MKIGFRKPSLKRSIKARTTGALKRKVKGAINPFYGKKGIDYITDPKRAIYNKIYKKTTVGVSDVARAVNKAHKINEVNTEPVQEENITVETKPFSPARLVIFIVLAFLTLLFNIVNKDNATPRVISAIVFLYFVYKIFKELSLKK